MEARVKERLTGAVVLVAIVVILVPELLSGPRRNAAPPPGSHTVRIDLTGPHRVAPAEPATATTAAAEPVATGSVMSVRPEGPSVPVAADSAAPDVESPTAGPATDADAAVEMPPPVAAAPARNGSSGAHPPARAAAPPAEHAASTAAPAAAESAALHPPAATPAQARPAAQAPLTAPAAAVSGWVVQLGSFANRDNAQKLVQELHHKGYSAFVSEYRGNDKVLFRVRVGPEQDRARADALRLRLGHEGYVGSVTPHP